MKLLSKLQTYASSWEVTDSDKIDAAELEMIESNRVVEGQYGLSVCLMLKGGSRAFIPVSRNSSVEVDDTVDLKSARILKLERAGSEPIFRIECRAEM